MTEVEPEIMRLYEQNRKQQSEETIEETRKSLGKTARFLNIGKGKPRITREHVHSPVKITVEFCPDCGKVLGGGERKK